MKIETALQKLHHCKVPELKDYTTLNKITEAAFYYPSPLKEQLTCEKCRFILFSAPGAVGKTALAKHIAYEYGGLYWNIGAKPVGDTAFAGAITHAVGVGNGAQQDALYASLRSGDSLIVLDAFDEAALLSKKEGVRDFLIEIGNILPNADVPSIVLTARTEMAQYIRDVCEEHGFSLACYELDYFEEENASDFIEKYLSFKNVSLNAAQKSSIFNYIEDIKRRIGDQVQIRQFIGYAQVLSILARQFEQAFKSVSGKAPQLSDHVDRANFLIYDIIQNLLEREQEKLKAFKDHIRGKYQGRENIVDILYSKQEQIVRLFYYTLTGGISLDDVFVCKSLLPEDQMTYLQLLKEWLPQHVFLDNGKLMPIFNDYMLAEALLNSELELFAETYQELESTSTKLPTRVFMECYLAMNNNCVNSDHIYFLDMAYSSQASTESKVFCDIGVLGADEEEKNSPLYMTFITNQGGHEEHQTIKIQCPENEPICLNRAENINVCVEGKVRLVSRFSQDVIIREASIECDQLALEAQEISFETYEKEENRLIIHKEISRTPISKIYVKGTKELRVELPQESNEIYKGAFYEFNDYLFSFDVDDEADLNGDEDEQFIHGLKKVLEQFKTDKYNSDPAKYKEKIDARCHTGVKARVLQFLKDENLIYEDGMMYKCRLTKMDELGISRVAYLQAKKEQLMPIYNTYRTWCKEHK
ncbi:hypothetical protein SDC9_58657 [bioreactor metagenome]|uniref:Uncharacterized protein n=1 Tax=bioreactor metagenome TaxID=1076179 RepID=A0A644X807_9ZZZZ